MIDYRDYVEVESMTDEQLKEHGDRLIELVKRLLGLMSQIHQTRNVISQGQRNFYDDWLRYAMEDIALECCGFASTLNRLMNEAIEERDRRCARRAKKEESK